MIISRKAVDWRGNTAEDIVCSCVAELEQKPLLVLNNDQLHIAPTKKAASFERLL